MTETLEDRSDARAPDRLMLKVRGLGKTYDPSAPPVLQGLDLEVADGEFVSILGPSGCGKTTALRAVAGLVEQSSGTIYVNGRESTGPSADKAMVFQGFNLFPWMSALHNAAFGLEMQGVPKKERRQRAAEYMELVGLSDRLEYYPAQLSGGQQQRVGLARALAIEPKLLLMDEPFGALDALTREQLQEMLVQICEQKGLSALFVTHSIDEAIYLSDRIIVMGATPGLVLATFDVHLPWPRAEYNWRAEPEYAELREAAWKLLDVTGRSRGESHVHVD
jgi:NitT/TauT family transport system ATP-binding protein